MDTCIWIIIHLILILLKKELQGKEEIIKAKEQEIKKYRNINQHL